MQSPIHEGYEYQDYFTVSIILQLMLKQTDAEIIIDRKDFSGDKFDDLKVKTPNGTTEFQIKYSDDEYSHKLAKDDFANGNGHDTALCDLFASWKTRKESENDTQIKLCLAWNRPDDDDPIVEFLKPIQEQALPFSIVAYSFDGEVFWPVGNLPPKTWRKFNLAVKSGLIDREAFLSFCNELTIILEMPKASLDLKNPGGIENVIIRQAEKLGVGIYPNDNLNLEEVIYKLATEVKRSRAMGNRLYINAKYLRALQCMLIPTQGKGIQGRSFFEADFGKTAEDFVMYLAMPERLLNKRGHFVERKDEPKFEREIRYTQWSENRHLIDTWMKYYSMFEKDTVLEYIGCNRFSVETLDKIENEELKKLYFLYLTPSATIRVFSDCTEDTKRIISTFISEELPFMYSRIVETILSSKPGYKVIAGILENFGEKVCTDLLKKIDLFSGHDNDKLTMLIKANKSKRLVDFDFALLQFIPYFHVSNLLSKQEEQIIMNSAYELKEAPIRKILLLHLDELKDVLIKTNGAQPGDTQIISVIEEQIKELYHQISIFEL